MMVENTESQEEVIIPQSSLQKVCWETKPLQIEKDGKTEDRIQFKPKTLNGRYIKREDGKDVSFSALVTRPKDEVKRLIEDKGFDTSNLVF